MLRYTTPGEWLTLDPTSYENMSDLFLFYCVTFVVSATCFLKGSLPSFLWSDTLHPSLSSIPDGGGGGGGSSVLPSCPQLPSDWSLSRGLCDRIINSNKCSVDYYPSLAPPGTGNELSEARGLFQGMKSPRASH